MKKCTVNYVFQLKIRLHEKTVGMVDEMEI